MAAGSQQRRVGLALVGESTLAGGRDDDRPHESSRTVAGGACVYNTGPCAERKAHFFEQRRGSNARRAIPVKNDRSATRLYAHRRRICEMSDRKCAQQFRPGLGRNSIPQLSHFVLPTSRGGSCGETSASRATRSSARGWQIAFTRRRARPSPRGRLFRRAVDLKRPSRRVRDAHPHARRIAYTSPLRCTNVQSWFRELMRSPDQR